jgi:hypothetical protein
MEAEPFANLSAAFELRAIHAHVLAALAIQHDADLVFGREVSPGLPPDVLHNPLRRGLGRRFCIGGFGTDRGVDLRSSGLVWRLMLGGELAVLQAPMFDGLHRTLLESSTKATSIDSPGTEVMK